MVLAVLPRVFAGDLPESPQLARGVVDYMGLLSEEDRVELEQQLVVFERNTSTEIVIVIVDDLAGYNAGQFAKELGKKWGVGKKGEDNGIVVLVKPKGKRGQRKTFIAVGAGLETLIPNAVAKLIVQKEMIPAFKNKKFYVGLQRAVDVLQSLVMEEYAVQDYEVAKGERQSFYNWIPLLIFAGIFLLPFLVFLYRARRYAVENNVTYWMAYSLLINSSNSNYSWDDFRSGSGGFDGGGFGGGGAGGSW
ncbi:MAG: TPM domain-containing protein [Salibacteraceae bacterium]